jgi:hypothetical protein
MADQEDFVIVDEDGTEHHFPAGMDPKKAAAVVRSQGSTKPVPDPHQARMSAAFPSTGLPANTEVLGAPLMGPAKVAQFTGGAIRTAAPVAARGLGAAAQFAGENFPTLSNPGRPVAAALKIGGRLLSGVGKTAATAEQALAPAEQSTPLVRLATQGLPNMQEIETAMRAAKLPENQIQNILQQMVRDLVSSKQMR